MQRKLSTTVTYRNRNYRVYLTTTELNSKIKIHFYCLLPDLTSAKLPLGLFKDTKITKTKRSVKISRNYKVKATTADKNSLSLITSCFCLTI